MLLVGITNGNFSHCIWDLGWGLKAVCFGFPNLGPWSFINHFISEVFHRNYSEVDTE